MYDGGKFFLKLKSQKHDEATFYLVVLQAIMHQCFRIGPIHLHL